MKCASVILATLTLACISLGCSSSKTSEPSEKGTVTETKSTVAPTSNRKGSPTPEALIQRFPEAIANTENYAALLPDEALLKAAMTCTDKHPLIEMLKKAHGLMAKNVQSAKGRVGLGRVVYEGIQIRDTQKISAGEVDKGCTTKVDIEIKTLTAKLKFITRSGKAKVSGGIVNAIRLGNNGWFVLKM